jgi:hypothetical protein
MITTSYAQLLRVIRGTQAGELQARHIANELMRNQQDQASAPIGIICDRFDICTYSGK